MVRSLAWGVAAAAAMVGCASEAPPPSIESSQQAIIECNSTTVGQLCDTDNTVCTIEICERQGMNVVCVLERNANDGAPCESDGDACSSDVCEDGMCRHQALPEATVCNDALFCTSGELCTGGACGGGVDTCDDGNPCTADSCDEGTDSCTNTPLVGMACDDGDACTVGTTCEADGSCGAGAPLDCDDGNSCTANVCDSDTGCVNDPLAAGTACDDGLFCTVTDTCDGAGTCDGSPNCIDGDSCTIDSCDEAMDVCVNDVDPGITCDDGNSCTEDDACAPGGGCAGTPVSDGTVCSTAGGCEVAGTCTAGVCSGTTDAPDGTACDDGDACTGTDECNSGACIPGAALDCDDGNQCTDNTCHPLTGCVNDPLAAGAVCDDGLFCTIDDTCDGAGACTAASASCDDGNPCTTDACDEAGDVCTNDIDVGASCDDGDACTGATTCEVDGSCGGGTPLDCDDGNQCTDDTCDAILGCVNDPAPAGTACDDGLFCSVDDACDGAGGCTGALNCIDGDACTIDSCDEDADACANEPDDGMSCDDGNDCTATDVCVPGDACAGTPVDDGTACTAAGGCEVAGTCTAGVCGDTTTAPDGTSCDDNDACTVSDSCTAGACDGSPRDCNDNDQCTIDGCDPVLGCINEPNPLCDGPDAGPIDVPDAGAGDLDAGPGAVDAGPNAPDAAVNLPDAGPAGPDAGDGFSGLLGGGGGCTCDTTGRGAGSLWLAFIVAGLLLRRARRRAVALLLAAVALIGAGSHARADGFDAELYRPAPSSSGYFSQDGAHVIDHKTLNLGLAFSLASNLLVLRDPETDEPLEDGRVLSDRMVTHLVAAIGLLDRIELGVDIPLAVSQDGDVSRLRMGEELSSTAFGDIQLAAKARIARAGALAVAVGAELSLPTGDGEAFFGGDSVAFTPRLIVGLGAGRISAAVNAGYRVRDGGGMGDLVIDDEVVLGGGASVAIVPRTLWALGEVHAAIGVQGDDTERERPAEFVAGARWAIAGPWVVQGGLGAGITRGYGAPELRGVLTVAYAPQRPAPVQVVAPLIVQKPEPEPEPPPPPADTDGDGIIDPDDGCPAEPEDVDGFDDTDGCPDPDNDGDKIADVDDQCPDEAEVVNSIKDEDGCPDEGLFVMVENRIVLDERILFDLMRARVKHRARPTLQAIVDLWNQHPEYDKMIIEGHTDDRGTEKYNQWLSEKRASRVKEFLVKLGMPEDKIETVGYGKTRPLDPDAEGEQGHQRNRRVEFVIIEAHQELVEKDADALREVEVAPRAEDGAEPAAE